ncbi:MAG TPA: response regulator transcription factor, partial [Burkholderiaceae bacterium]|nr:response regulator transcription factor [Burkholderiaceae bacterium]
LSVRDAGDARARCDALPPQQPVVLLLADPLDDSTARALARQRAVAMLPAGVGAFRLRAAIEAVSVGLHVSGFTSFPRGAGRAASASTDARPDEGLPDEHLTPREVEVLELLGKGLTNADLGRTLRISSHTAKYHVAQILAKLGASSRAEAVHTGLRRGLIGL